MTCRVPVPVHINNLGTPRVQQIGQLSPKPQVAVLPEVAGSTDLQQRSDSNDHTSKLLSLPSFGKVVYRSSIGGPLNAALSKQRSISCSAATAVHGVDSQQLLLQGHASVPSRLASLEFDSQFESGNLQKAVQASACHAFNMLAACRLCDTSAPSVQVLAFMQCLWLAPSLHEVLHNMCTSIQIRMDCMSLHVRLHTRAFARWAFAPWTMPYCTRSSHERHRLTCTHAASLS